MPLARGHLVNAIVRVYRRPLAETHGRQRPARTSAHAFVALKAAAYRAARAHPKSSIDIAAQRKYQHHAWRHGHHLLLLKLLLAAGIIMSERNAQARKIDATLVKRRRLNPEKWPISSSCCPKCRVCNRRQRKRFVAACDQWERADKGASEGAMHAGVAFGAQERRARICAHLIDIIIGAVVKAARMSHRRLKRK